MNRWPPLAATDTSRMCQRITLRTTQHGLRFRTPSEPKAHCGLSEWRGSRLKRDVASTRGPLHISP